VRLLGGPHSVPHLGRAWPVNGDGMRLAAESGRTGMESDHGDSAVMRSTTTRRRQVCLELLPASRHHPGGQQGDAGGGGRSDPYCGVWGTALAPTVVHARGSAPRRLVTRPFFHGLAPQQHTRLRALGLATPAVAVDAQQVKQRTCSSARATRGEGAGSRVDGVPRLVVLASRRGASCWPKFWGVQERARSRVRVGASEHGWYYVHAEGSGATSQARGQVTDTRGSHKDGKFRRGDVFIARAV